MKSKGIRRNFIQYAVELLLCFLGAGLLIYRVRYGIDFTDESWYVAEPYAVARGAIPYTENISQASGFTIPLAFAYRVFLLMNGGTEGIFLFSRYLYVVWIFGVTGLTIFFMNRNTALEIKPLYILPVLFLNMSGLFDINYNTIGQVYLPLIFALVFSKWNGENAADKRKYGFWAGIVTARAVIGTPYILIAWFLLLIVMCVCKEWGRLQGYLAGVVSMAVLVVGGICVRGGIHRFVNGLYYLFQDYGYFKIAKRTSLQENMSYFYNFLKPFFVFCAIVLVLKLILIKHKKIYNALLCVCALAFFCAGMYLGRGHYTLLVRWGWFESIPLAMLAPDIEKRKEIKISAIITGIYAMEYFCSSLTNVYGFRGRDYWLTIPLLLSLYAAIRLISQKYLQQVCSYSILIALTGLFMRETYDNVYRDASMDALTCRVDSGVWRGCYTTPERAENVRNLEEQLKMLTEESDEVLYLDWCSFGYLMGNGTACAPSTLDACGYSYSVNSPEIYYDYFGSRGVVPDKIIYIDYGRDEVLSIEASDWRFNQFVEAFYDRKKSYENDLFRVVMYEVNNREEALAFSIQRASR